MRITTKILASVLPMTVVVLAGVASAQTHGALPTAEDVVARSVALDALRQAQLSGYTATRRYVAVNKERRAEMLVAVNCASDGSKQFTILSEQGSSAIRKRVFYKMLKEEEEASRHSTRQNTRIIPANYEFQLTGETVVNGRPAYVLDVTPKQDSKYLIDGTIWIDAIDYSIVRVEGSPARDPSFWTHSVHFVHTYRQVGPFWLAASTYAVSQIRILGRAELTIETSDYSLNPTGGYEVAATGSATRLGQ